MRKGRMVRFRFFFLLFFLFLHDGDGKALEVELSVSSVADVGAWKHTKGGPVTARDGEVAVLDEGMDTGESRTERRARTIRSVATLRQGRT